MVYCFQAKSPLLFLFTTLILAVLHDLEGYIVVESDNALLVCKRTDEQRIRQFVNDVSMLPESEKFIWFYARYVE